MVRDERRFKMADKDGDLIATKEEFTAFLHPEEYDYMKDIVVQVGESQDSQQNLRFSLWCLCSSRFRLSSAFGRMICCAGAGQVESRLCHSVLL